MVGATTTTTTTATAVGPSLPMNLSQHPETTGSTSSSHQESIDSPKLTMQPFVPGQCLFCPISSPSFDESVIHMRKSHGLFVPHEQRLAVDLETLFKYLHLVIFGYRECLHCGTERTTVQAVQQHMTGKGHCRFDISEEDSEFAEFYDFSSAEEDEDIDEDGDEDDEDDIDGRRREEKATSSSSRKPVLADEDSIRLPSGKIISRHSSSAPAGPSSSLSSNHLRRRTRATPTSSRLEYTLAPEESPEDKGTSDTKASESDTRLLSKREKRERANVAYQMANMSANDRNSLVHLPASQQRALLLTQQRQEERVQKAERRRQGKIDRKGNKNLYAYWHTETPVYQCG
jgi:pre-60S factor REI1